MLTFVSPVQPKNAYEPICVTPSGILISVSLVQLLKALRPIIVTLLGMLISESAEQPQNAPSMMLVTPSPITMLLISKQYGDSHGWLVISPVPVMVRTPSSSNVHVRFSPQVPLWTTFAAKALAGSRENTISSASMRPKVFFFIFFLLLSMNFRFLDNFIITENVCRFNSGEQNSQMCGKLPI